MPIEDTYTTLTDRSEGQYRARGSKFIAYAVGFDHENQLSEHLAAVKADHPKARHWCYAYRLGLSGDRWRANDDGEPSGSAGRPILGQIDGAGLTNVLIIVVRYFGGTKLGVPGLIEAYRTAAAEAILAGTPTVRVVERSLRVTTDYTRFNALMQAANSAPWRIDSQEMTDSVTLRLACPASQFEAAYVTLWLVLAEAYPGEERLDRSPPGYDLTLVE